MRGPLTSPVTAGVVEAVARRALVRVIGPTAGVVTSRAAFPPPEAGGLGQQRCVDAECPAG
jgi:hypothetical protein